MMHELRIRVGPAAFRIGSAWRAPVAALERLYAAYPTPSYCDYTVRLEPPRPWRGDKQAVAHPTRRMGMATIVRCGLP